LRSSAALPPGGAVTNDYRSKGNDWPIRFADLIGNKHARRRSWHCPDQPGNAVKRFGRSLRHPRAQNRFAILSHTVEGRAPHCRFAVAILEGGRANSTQRLRGFAWGGLETVGRAEHIVPG
jgi:hypothetical protein